MNFTYTSWDGGASSTWFGKLKLFGCPGRTLLELIRCTIAFGVYLLSIALIGFESLNPIILIFAVIWLFFAIKLVWRLFILLIVFIASPLVTINTCKRLYIYCRTGKVSYDGYHTKVIVRGER